LNLSTTKFHFLDNYVHTTMCTLYKDLGVLIPSQHNLYDLCSSADDPSTDAHLEQRELAHCLVKWLYGRTNKHDATWQIGQHVRQLECAQLAADHHQLKMQSETCVNIEENTDQYLNKQYHISNS
jgi:hypothetical protein